MFTARIQAKATKKGQASCKLISVSLQHTENFPILGIDGQEYLVCETTAGEDFGIGRSFRLRKFYSDVCYNVFVATEVNSKANWCDCEGFKRFGYCKHIDALRYLILMGVIDEQPAPVLEQGQPEPADLFEPEEMGLFC